MTKSKGKGLRAKAPRGATMRRSFVIVCAHSRGGFSEQEWEGGITIMAVPMLNSSNVRTNRKKDRNMIQSANHSVGRRDFIKQSAATIGAAAMAVGAGEPLVASTKQLFKISLAQWSLHRALFKGDLNNLDFAKTARLDFGIGAVEYVNQFFKDKAKDRIYLG